MTPTTRDRTLALLRDLECIDDEWGPRCATCDTPEKYEFDNGHVWTPQHAPDCEWVAVVAALEGEPDECESCEDRRDGNGDE